MICTAYRILLVGEIKESDTGGPCTRTVGTEIKMWFRK